MTNQNQNKIPVVLITDNNFVMQTSVAITSIIENRKSTQYNIFVIGSMLSDSNKKILKSMANEDCSIEIFDGDTNKIKNLHKYNVQGQGHYLSASEAALFKFDLPEIFPNHNKIIYIDGDTIVLNSLEHLYNTELENNYVAAAHDTGKIYFKHKFVLECPDYFNSGVMLLNLDLMRQDNITEKLIQTKLNLTDSNLMDQNVLNIVFKDKIKIIDIKYNLLVLNLERALGKWQIEDINLLFNSTYADFEDIKRQACIIHFSSKEKPWKYSNVTYAKEWYEYYLKSPFSSKHLNRAILPKISIIIPIFNAEKYLRDCIDSIITQSLQDLEIICIDDCSTDSSLKILKEYELRDNRIKVIANTKNLKQGGARNKGLKIANAPYIMFVDADDYLHPEALKNFYNTMINSHVDLVVSHVENFSNNPANSTILNSMTSYYEKCKKTNGTHSVKSPLGFRSGPVAKLFKKDILDKYNIKFPEKLIQEDEAFHWAYFSRISNLYFLEQAYYYRRIHTSSTMVQRNNNNTRILDMIKILDIIYTDLRKNNLYKKYKNDYLKYFNNHKNQILSSITNKKLKNKVNKKLKSLENKILFTPIQKVFSSQNIGAFKYIWILGMRIKLKRKQKKQIQFVKKIFSITNIGIYKVITILGFKLKIKLKKLIQQEHIKQLEQKITNTNKLIKAQQEQINAQHEILNRYQEQTKLELNRLKQDYNQKIYSERSKLLYKIHKYLPEEKRPEALKDWFLESTGDVLNLENPQTFNEKIQWLKLYDSTPEKTRLADKYLVRDWVKEKIGEEYLIPLLGVWDTFEDIDFDTLPDQFVLKCNHGCGYNIIVKDKSSFNKEDARKKINYWLNQDYSFRCGFELHYSDIPRKIIAEKYIENDNEDLYDYKFWCFNGKVEYIQFLSERNTKGLKMAFYDRDWNKQDFVYSYPLDIKNIDKPENLGQMIELAEKLAQDFNHVRVDFYILNNGDIKFGEMTFTPMSGLCKWNIEEINYSFGNLLTTSKG